MDELRKSLEGAVASMLKKHAIAVDELTERQLAESVSRAIECGDFVKLCSPSGGQQIVYIPFRELETVKNLYHELLYAVERKFPGETRHETALRYIRECEKRDQFAEPAVELATGEGGDVG